MCEIRLCCTQLLLRALGSGDVHHRANEFQLIRLIPDGPADDVNVFDRSIRHQQAMLKIKIGPGAGSVLDDSLYEGEIFRMDPLQHHLEYWRLAPCRSQKY